MNSHSTWSSSSWWDVSLATTYVRCGTIMQWNYRSKRFCPPSYTTKHYHTTSELETKRVRLTLFYFNLANHEQWTHINVQHDCLIVSSCNHDRNPPFPSRCQISTSDSPGLETLSHVVRAPRNIANIPNATPFCDYVCRIRYWIYYAWFLRTLGIRYKNKIHQITWGLEEAALA